jgi:hypothetical protein
MDDIKIAQATITVNDNLSILESLSAKRTALVAITEEQVKSIDAARKVARKGIKEAFSTLPCVDAVSLCNRLGKSPYGSDDATRQRYARRRSTMIKELESAFPDYDFVSNRGTVTATLIGDAREREARQIFSTLQELKDRGFGLDMTVDEIKTKIAKPANISAATDSLPSVNDMTKAIIDKLTSGQAVKDQSGESKLVNQA